MARVRSASVLRQRWGASSLCINSGGLSTLELKSESSNFKPSDAVPIKLSTRCCLDGVLEKLGAEAFLEIEMEGDGLKKNKNGSKRLI